MSSDALPSELYVPEFAPEWDRHQLYSLAKWVNGMAFKNIDFSPSGTPVVKIAEIKNGVSSQTKFTRATYDPKYFLRDGDMLFCWSGQPETSIDTYWWRGGDGWLNQHIFKVQPKPSDVDVDFFFQLLRYLRPSFVRIARNKQTTGLGHVTKSDLERLTVGIPARAEQLAIARLLGALDDKIESNRRAIAVAEELARSTFEQLFDLEQVDGGASLSELMNVNPRRVLRPGTPATYVGMSSLPEFSAEIYQWGTREAGSGQRFVSGDVLMARITPCLENGKTAVVDMLRPDEVGWGSTEYVVLSPTGLLSTAWIYCLVRDERIRDFAIRSMTGTSGRQRFQADRFSQYRIVSPEAVDLIRFNAIAEPLFTKMTELRDETLKLTAFRDTLLPELLSGRIRVPLDGVTA